MTILAVGALWAPSAAAEGLAPAGFFGMAPQGSMASRDYALMQRSGIESVRLPLYWLAIEPQPANLYAPNWASFDRDVALAAEHQIRIFPFVLGAPEWVAPFSSAEPVESGWQRFAWTRFLGDVARRYGPGGDFWLENPELPRLPIHRWEIWNEENIVTFSHHPNPSRFARLIRMSGRILHREDPSSQVILGGFFGRPLQVPPNIRSGDFLSRFYRAGDVKRFFDGIALHPYVARAEAMRGEILNLRRVMRSHHDASTPLYVTELGWGSDSFESRWERGWLGQARELDRSFSMLSANRHRWRVGGAWWFTWSDVNGGCQFCDSAGLLTLSGQAKPAWYAFNEWTGGDAATVQRATEATAQIAP